MIADFPAAVCNATAWHEDYHWGSSLSCWLQPVQNSCSKTRCFIQDVANSGLHWMPSSVYI